MNNLIDFSQFKKHKDVQAQIESVDIDPDYESYILSLDRLELLEEMVRFQQERSAMGCLTREMIIQGRYLFKALYETAETEELRLLTKSYKKHLDLELMELNG